MSDIFISHASVDRAHADRIKTRLAELGYRNVFLDFEPDHGIAAGSKWLDVIQREVSSATALIFACSPASQESQWCFVELAYASMLGKHLFPVKVEPCDPSELLTSSQWIDLTADDDEAEWRKLERGLIECGLESGAYVEWDRTRPVYPGFYAFDERDAAIYFGRSKEIDTVRRILARMQLRRDHPLALVLGSSGCGKSSLVRAGVVPRLRRDPDRWIVVPSFRPGETPFEKLATALVTAFERYDHVVAGDEIATRLAKDPTGRALVGYAQDLQRAAKTPEASVLLVLDQMEELFSGDTPAEEAAAFLRMSTSALSAAGSPLLAIATMRSELLAHFQNHEVTRTFPFESFLLGQMPAENLWEVIAKPAERTGLAFEDGLVERMVTDTKTGEALPLLAFTLGRMLQRKERNRFTHALYDSVGGIQGAVAERAQEVLSGSTLTDDQRQALRSAFVRLVRDVDGRQTRRRVAWNDIPEAARGVLEEFVDAGLLMSSNDPKTGHTVEVVHEVLFTAWSELATWLKEERHYLLWWERFAVALKEYQDNQGAEDGLLWGVSLALAREWLQKHPDRFDAPARAFVERSTTAERRAGLRHRAVWAAGIALPLFVLLGVQLLRHQQKFARSGAFVAAALSQMASDPERSLQLVLRARDILPTAQTDDALRRAMVTSHVRTVLEGHGQPLTSAVFAGHRGTVVTTSYDGVRLWNPGGAGRTLQTVVTHRAAVSPDGRLVVTASGDQTARVWDVETGGLVATLASDGGTSDRRYEVYDAAFSPDGARIVTAQGNGAFVFDATSGTLVASLIGHTDWVTRVAIDPTGRRVATASNDGSARLWDPTTGARIGASMDHSGKVLGIAFSPDGRRLATASEDKTARLWSSLTGAPLAELRGHGAPVWSAAFHPSGRLVVTASEDGSARVWDVVDGRELTTLRGHAGAVRSALFSPDGGLIATASEDATARVWETDGWRQVAEMRGHAAGLWSAAFNPEGRALVTASDDGTARVWQIESDTGIRELPPHGQGVRTALFSKDSQLVLTAGEDQRARIWDFQRARTLATIGTDERPATGAVFSPNEQIVVTFSSAGFGGVWSAGDGTLVTELPGATPVNAAAFMPDGRFLATAGDDGAVAIWDARSWTTVATLVRHTGAVLDVAFSPDGTLLATVGQDGALRISKTDAWSNAPHTFAQHPAALHSVAFDSGGRQLVSASADRTAVVWDVATERPTATLRAHTAPILRAVFSPDGKFVATASRDHTARVWDAATGVPVATLFGHAGPVYSVAFSPAQKFILTASGDRTIKTHRWETFAPVDELINASATRVAKHLEPSELDGYVAEPRIGWFGWFGSSSQARESLPRPVTVAKGE